MVASKAAHQESARIAWFSQRTHLAALSQWFTRCALSDFIILLLLQIWLGAHCNSESVAVRRLVIMMHDLTIG